MKIINLLKKSENIAVVIDETLHGARIPSQHKYMIAGGAFDVVLEHQKAIKLLIKEGFYGSAFSLVRSLFETYIRGIWILNCANEKQIERFLKDKVDQTLNEIIDAIENVPGFDGGVLSKIKTNSYKPMCSYTHGGWLQIGRRFKDQFIEAEYEENEIIEAINFSNTIAMLSAHEIAKMTQSKEIISSIQDLYLKNT